MKNHKFYLLILTNLILQSFAIGQVWHPLEMHGGGKVTGVIFHPTNANIIYNRTDVAGLNVSYDGGETWESLTLNVPKDNPHNFTTRNLAVDPADPSILYYCSGNAPTDGNSSIFKSTDGGDTWSRITNPTNFSGNQFLRWGDETFVIDPTNTTNLFVGGQPTLAGGAWQSTGGLFHSTDSGQSWSEIHAATFEKAWITAVKYHPADQNLLYISAIAVTSGGVTSTGKGLWEYNISTGVLEQMHAEDVVDFEFDAITHKIIVSRKEGINIYNPIDDTWSGLVAPLGLEYDYYITAHPTISGRWYFGGYAGFDNNGLVETTDGGVTYHQSKYTGGSNIFKLHFPPFSQSNFRPGHSNSMAGIYFSPHDNNIAFMDGIWKTTSASSSLVSANNPNDVTNNGNWDWTWVANGIHIMVTIRCSPHPTDTDRFTINVADVGEYTTTDGGKEMKYPGLLLHYSASTVYAKSDTDIGYTVGERYDDTGQLRKTTDGGKSWFSPMTNNFFEDAKVIQDLKICDANSDHLVVGVDQNNMASQIYRSADGGATWTSWDQGISQPAIFKEWESFDRLLKDDNDVFYVFKGSKIYYRGWNDSTWTLITHPLGTATVNQMVTHPGQSGVLFLTFSNDQIYKWDNGTWSNFTSATNVSELIAVSPNGTIVVLEKLWIGGQRTQKLFIKYPGQVWEPLTFEGFGGVMKSMIFLDDDRLVGLSNGQGANILHLDENPACLHPWNLYTANIEDNSANVYWSHPDSPTIMLDYKKENDAVWTTIASAVSGQELTGLDPCSTYDIRIQADCGGGSSDTLTSQFTTVATTPYCDALPQSSWRYWIREVMIDTDTYSSQWDGGYKDWACEKSTDFIAGDDINFTFTPGYLDDVKNVVWYAWIDFNRDGQWNQSEQVVSSSPSDVAASFTVATDQNLASGPLHMRVTMHRFWQNTSLGPCDAYSPGETEDFVLNVIADPCLLVTNTNDDGAGSLRAAIACAQSNDVIQFHPSLQGDTINLTSLVLVINKDLSIVASASDNIYISAEAIGKAMIVNVFKQVNITGLHIIAGNASFGRAIYNRGACTLDNVTIYENASYVGSEDKVYNEGDLTIVNTVGVR